MWLKVKAAAEKGIIFGVEWGIALAILLGILFFAMRDYNTVKMQANHGEQAYQYLAQAQAAAQKPPAEKGVVK